MEGVDQCAPMTFLVENAREEAIPRPLGVDHLGTDLLELPVAGEGKCDLVPPTTEVFRVVTLPEEHADVDSLILQGINEVHQVSLDPAAIAVLPVISDKCNHHRDPILMSDCKRPCFLYILEMTSVSTS